MTDTIEKVATDRFGMKTIPTEIRFDSKARILHVTFDDGKSFNFTAEFLRVESPSAEVQGHSADQKQLVGGKRNVGIIGIDPVGNYAVRIRFDDLHDTGIYSWEYLYNMGEAQDAIWQAYVKALEEAGLSRDL